MKLMKFLAKEIVLNLKVEDGKSMCNSGRQLLA